jgi:hypothetical protein
MKRRLFLSALLLAGFIRRVKAFRSDQRAGSWQTDHFAKRFHSPMP